MSRYLSESRNATMHIVYAAATSLDGYIATEDGSVDWRSSFDVAEEDHGTAALEKSVDALLLGSHTYEFALKLGQWPSPHKPSWVFTRRKLRVLQPSVTLTSQSPAEVVALLKTRGIRSAWLMGGGKKAGSFHTEGLISEFVVSVFPILLSSGIPLFAPHSCRLDTLRLIKAKPFKSGVVQLSYAARQTA